MPRVDDDDQRRKRKRKLDDSSSSSSDDSTHKTSKKKRSESRKSVKSSKSKGKKSRKYCSSSSSDSESSSSDHRQKKSKKKRKKKKSKHKKIKKNTEGSPKSKHGDVKSFAMTEAAVGPTLDASEAEKTAAKGPMTKEMWEKQQSAVKRVYDTDTGRTRLVKGSGEILEEIVSKKQQRQINKLATQGDGISYSLQTGTLR